MDSPATALSLFAGIAGIDLGLGLAVPELRTVCYVEREAYCCEVLAARMEEGHLAPAPIWTDVTTFDGRPWRGLVDCITGGFPCQDISNAGKRAGIEGERSGLWFEYARIIREVAPRYVFVENVAALVQRGLDTVLGTLADLGFNAEWDVFSAAEVGAPHLRKRLFLLAYGGQCRGWQEGRPEPSGEGPSWVGERGDDVAHGGMRFAEQHAGRGSESREAQSGRPHGQPSGCGVLLEHASCRSGALRAATPQQLERTASAGDYPPGPDGDWTGIPEAAQPAVRGVADGITNRVDRLRALGNGVVPDVAALAWRTLYGRIGGGVA